MKIQIDTTLKIVIFLEPVDFETMESELPKLLGEDWKIWKIELNYYPQFPIYPVYPTYPTMPEPPYYWNPPVTCDTNAPESKSLINWQEFLKRSDKTV